MDRRALALVSVQFETYTSAPVLNTARYYLFECLPRAREQVPLGPLSWSAVLHERFADDPECAGTAMFILTSYYRDFPDRTVYEGLLQFGSTWEGEFGAIYRRVAGLVATERAEVRARLTTHLTELASYPAYRRELEASLQTAMERTAGFVREEVSSSSSSN
jgi:hypothetical protein